MSIQSSDIIKVVLVGPESSGKSTLCVKLAQHYNALYVEEFVRKYLHDNGASYSYNDLTAIATGQLNEEKKSIEKLAAQSSSHHPRLLFVDTDLYVIKIWSELVYNKCAVSILNALAINDNHLYLLCEPDIPWMADPLREYPDEKSRILHYHHYKDAMINQPIEWININGDYEERWQTALNAIDKLLQ